MQVTFNSDAIVTKSKTLLSGMNILTANLRRRHDFPTPESPINKSLNK